MAKAIRVGAWVEEFTIGSPAQQLVDRLLLGFPRRGDSLTPRTTIAIHTSAANGQEEIDRRVAEHGLRQVNDLEELTADSEALLVVPRGPGHRPAAGRLESVLSDARPGAKIFVHGVISPEADSARRCVQLASSRGVSLCGGSYLPATWRLPSVDLKRGTPTKNALIVAVGEPREAEFLGVDGLLPVIERRMTTIDGSRVAGEAGVRSVRFIAGRAVWKRFDKTHWGRELLAAAISRSDTPQGDAIADGRTQDLLGLDLVQKLARDPILYLIEHQDGLQSGVLLANGVIGDINFAVRSNAGDIISAQLLRPRGPQAHHWTALAQRVEDFFVSGNAPWTAARSVLTAQLLETFGLARARPGERIKSTGPAVSYPAPLESTYLRT